MATSKPRIQDVAGKAGDTQYELGNYRLHERIGQEELAMVYRATHLALDRPVQFHLQRRTDWVSASRFQLAARLSARLSHSNLLPVIDAGQDDKKRAYLVTPLFEGKTVAELLQDGPLDPLLALRIVTQVAAALDYLHSQQVVHRDVQPANILITPQNVAYLTNLSLAASPDTPDLSELDEAEYLTPYSAPEQRLDQGEATAALDVYSLGAVLYHMLSGEVPAATGDALPTLGSRDPALSGADQVIRRMMAAQPVARYAGAGAAVAALRQALRFQIDAASDDMEESRWETVAEWLENPLEAALGDTLEADFKEFVAKTRKRADDLHRRDVIRRLLNRWSRNGFFRQRNLGQIIEPEQIVSYNIYFYDLRISYETRTAPQVKRRPKLPDDRNSVLPIPEVWEVHIPESVAGAEHAQELVLPNSTMVMNCPECGGEKTVVCRQCMGKGTIERVRKVRNPDNSVAQEMITEACPACRGYGKQTCKTCEGSGSMVEEQVFTWSRRDKLWQNTDDIEGLPTLALSKRAEPVYNGPIDPFEGRWHSVAPLTELLRAAINDGSGDMRVAAAELSIRGVPITEVDYQLNDQPRRLSFIGHDNELIGDWTLLNKERIALALLGGVALLALLVAALLFLVR